MTSSTSNPISTPTHPAPPSPSPSPSPPSPSSSQPPQPKRPTLALIGGGIGGLALSSGLTLRQIPHKIYESTPSFHEIGLGVSIGPAAHRCLPLINPRIRTLYDEHITTNADSGPEYEQFRDTWNEVMWTVGPKAGEKVVQLKARPSGQTSVRRAGFLDALVGSVPPGVAEFGKRVERVEDSNEEGRGGVRMWFTDGTHADADAVIGCDGIKSKVKEFILPEGYDKEATTPTYSGMYGYRAVLPMAKMVKAVGERRARVSTIYLMPGAYGITYPINRAESCNVGLYKIDDSGKGWEADTWVRPASREQMQEDFGEMGPTIGGILEQIEDPSQWAIFEHPPIPTFFHGRIALLGDAAHASTPHAGAGAGQAIEDAHVLSELLADSRIETGEDVIAAFEAYDYVRRPRSQDVVKHSKENEGLWCLRMEGVRDDEGKLRETLGQRFGWLWDIDVEGQVERAREKMVEILEVRRSEVDNVMGRSESL